MIEIFRVPLIKEIAVRELVPKVVYHRFGESAIRFIQPQLYHALIHVRVHFKRPLLINTWPWGGSKHFRGYRPSWCDLGAAYSAHRTGNAADFDVIDYGGPEVRETILAHPEWGFTRLEKNVSWVHADTVWVPGHDGVHTFDSD